MREGGPRSCVKSIARMAGFVKCRSCAPSPAGEGRGGVGEKEEPVMCFLLSTELSDPSPRREAEPSIECAGNHFDGEGQPGRVARATRARRRGGPGCPPDECGETSSSRGGRSAYT